MDIAKFDQKYVRLRTIYGNTHIGFATYDSEEFLECEFGGDEDGVRIEDFLIYNSQIESIEEVTPHGSAELWTEQMILRRYRQEDAEELYERFGKDPSMYEYSGWNPYATPEMAEETVRGFIKSYGSLGAYASYPEVDLSGNDDDADDHADADSAADDACGANDGACGANDDACAANDGACGANDGACAVNDDACGDISGDSNAGSSCEDSRTYSWVMDIEDIVVGTIGAYDYEDGRIEVGMSVAKDWQGRGLATEALTKVLHYLTENEGISVVTAWCAAENAGSARVLEKSGMQLVRRENGGLTVGGRTYDKLFFEYRKSTAN